MAVASRTPEGEPNRCTFCGKRSSLEPSLASRDAPCPHCGSLMWYLPHAPTLPPRETLFDDWINCFRALKAEGRLQSDLPRALMQCATDLAEARGVAVWRIAADGEWRVLSHAELPGHFLLEVDGWKKHVELLKSASSGPEPYLLGPNLDPTWKNGNPTQYFVALQRFRRDEDLLVLELFLAPTVSAGDKDFIQLLLATIQRVVAPSEGQRSFDPNVDCCPPSAVDPPVKLLQFHHLSRISWWTRLWSVLQPRRKKAHA